MDTFLWLVVFMVSALIAFRWMLTLSMVPLSHQSIRHLFLQHVLAAVPDARVLDEQSHRFILQIGGERCTIQTEQLFRRCAENPHHIRQLLRQAVTALTSAINEGNALPPDWEEYLYPLLVRIDQTTSPSLLLHPVLTPLAVGYAVRNETTFRWITTQDLDELGVEAELIRARAMRNLERSCNALAIEVTATSPDGDDRLLRFTTGDGLDAARFLLPSFYQRFSPRFDGADLLVAIPSRDSLAMISANDKTMAGVLEWKSARAQSQLSYSLDDSLFLVTESGLEVWPSA